MRAVPTFDDFWMTCDTVRLPLACESLMVLAPMVSMPPAVGMIVCGETMPLSIAAATVKGFMVEPGSNRSTIARLRPRTAL